MSLPAEVEASYVVIVDSILAKSDINTITLKKIREGLQAAVDYNITPQKDAIKALIMKRFDKFHAENAAKAEKPAPATNGIEHTNGVIKTEGASSVYLATTAQKRKSEDAVDRFASPVKKKKVKTEHQDDADAAFAARLQAEENSRARPTRKGAAKKTNPVKKRALKKKTPSKIKGEEDSDLDSSGEEKKVVNRSGGFHKPMLLSAPLSALLDGETQLSRPQTVKRIWQYVHAHELQDQSDKRWIICDDALRAVFKSDKVHMFTMNKILAKNLHNPDE